jgi:glycosyltransferase involved in cell wall biosynthesis
MRVLFWSPGFLPDIGGIEVLAGKFLPAMRRLGHEYIVISGQSDPNLPRRSNHEGIPLYRFPFWQSLGHLDRVMRLKQQLAEIKRSFAPDLIHLNGAGRDHFFHLITANACSAPTLVTLHGEWVVQADAIVASLLRSADWVAACSNAILEKGRRLVPEITVRSSVIHNAVDDCYFSPEPPPAAPQRLLCLGRLSHEKGFDLALRAFALVLERFPGARLVIAGDGPQRAALERLAAVTGIFHALEFLGWVSPEDVPTLIKHATAVIIPSRSESLPLVALEAALSARPVAGARVGGLPEVVRNRRTGLLVESENVEELAAAIVFLLERPEQAGRLGRAARRWARQAFGWETHLGSYDALYRNLALHRRSGHAQREIS